MPPKSERVELRIEAEMLERLDNWRMTQDDQPSRSEALRRLADTGLELDLQGGFRLNNRDKLLVWLMSEVLKAQVQGPKSHGDQHMLQTVDLIQEAIYGGHFWALVWEMQGVMHNHVDDPKRVRAVADILDVWFFIESAWARFSDEEKRFVEAETGVKEPKFAGFDGNYEGEYYSIASFFVEKLRRWQLFKGRDFNSHFPTVVRYSVMAAAFEPIRATLMGRELSAKEVVQLLKAQDRAPPLSLP